MNIFYKSLTSAEASEAHQDDLGHWMRVESGKLHGWAGEKRVSFGVRSGAGFKTAK